MATTGDRETVVQISTDDLTATDEYQVMDEQSENVPHALRESMDEDGFDPSQPITTDEDGNVLDGHHRLAAAREVGIGRVPVVRKTELTEDEKREQAYVLNLRRRNLDSGAKKEHAKSYLRGEYDAEEQTQTEVADLLGVSSDTVRRARNELADEGVEGFEKTMSGEEKRDHIREYIEDNPKASNRTVGDELDVSKTTVGNVRSSIQEEADEAEEGVDNISRENVTTEQDTTDEEIGVEENDETEVDSISGEQMTTDDEELKDEADAESEGEPVTEIEIATVFNEGVDEARPITASDVASSVGCNHEEALDMLNDMADRAEGVDPADETGLEFIRRREVGDWLVFWPARPTGLETKLRRMSDKSGLPITLGTDDEEPPKRFENGEMTVLDGG